MVTKVDDAIGRTAHGDVIEEVNQQPVTSVAEYREGGWVRLIQTAPRSFRFAGIARVRLSSCALARQRLRCRRISLARNARGGAARSESTCG